MAGFEMTDSYFTEALYFIDPPIIKSTNDNKNHRTYFFVLSQLRITKTNSTGGINKDPNPHKSDFLNA